MSYQKDGIKDGIRLRAALIEHGIKFRAGQWRCLIGDGTTALTQAEQNANRIGGRALGRTACQALATLATEYGEQWASDLLNAE